MDDSERELKEFEQQGHPVMQQGEWKEEPHNGFYAYLDMQDSLKCVIELLGHVKH